MFDIGALELLVIVIVAIVVIGPKDMPQALRVAGRWVGKFRRASAQFRSGFDNLVREAEMEEMERKWKEQNARIMAETPADEMGPLHEHEENGATAESAIKTSGKLEDLTAATSDPVAPDVTGEQAPAEKPKKASKASPVETVSEEPMLPLGKTKGQ
ncbi:MAG: Sec-independent protein translocase protein TatB [Pontixanthobacter sp.]